MQTALQNPHYKKIWERINWQIRHPEAKSLEEALEMELQNEYCLLLHKHQTNPTDIGFVKEFEILIINAFRNAGKPIENINKSILEMVNNTETKILGRPITLFDVINLINKNRDEKEDPLYYANGKRIFAIFCDENYCRKVCDFNTNLLEEQTPETWEKIANLID